MRRKTIFLRMISGLMSLLAVDVLSSAIWFYYIISSFTTEEEVWKADAGIVFMSNFNNDFTKLGDQTISRLNHTADLYQKGKIDYILCAGGARPQRGVYGSEWMRDVLVERGIPRERIVIEKISQDSKSNWRVACALIKANGWTTVAVISSPLHISRLKQVIRNMPLDGVKIIYSPFRYEDIVPSVSVLDLWQEIHHEWLGYLAWMVFPEEMYQRLIKSLRS